jgi:hypothetical protein
VRIRSPNPAYIVEFNWITGPKNHLTGLKAPFIAPDLDVLPGFATFGNHFEASTMTFCAGHQH